MSSDPFNSDDDPTLGWAISQIAFLCPKVREYERPVSVFFAKCKDLLPGKEFRVQSLDERLRVMARAADVCYEKRRLIYVMGHTHEPFLKRIVNVPVRND